MYSGEDSFSKTQSAFLIGLKSAEGYLPGVHDSPKTRKFPKNIPYHDIFMGTLPSSRRGKCVTLFGGDSFRERIEMRESKRFREKLLDRRSSFTSCRKSFNSLRSFDSLLSSELALEYFDTALTCTGVTSKIRSATSEAF
ncbi:hypothetical protein TNCV_3110391 [Trichonephila clavipes]|nr:hypothetical protein TNCV_3110391 [Trichonephila clavipes]